MIPSNVHGRGIIVKHGGVFLATALAEGVGVGDGPANGVGVGVGVAAGSTANAPGSVAYSR